MGRYDSAGSQYEREAAAHRPRLNAARQRLEVAESGGQVKSAPRGSGVTVKEARAEMARRGIPDVQLDAMDRRSLRDLPPGLIYPLERDGPFRTLHAEVQRVGGAKVQVEVCRTPTRGTYFAEVWQEGRGRISEPGFTGASVEEARDKALRWLNAGAPAMPSTERRMRERRIERRVIVTW